MSVMSGAAPNLFYSAHVIETLKRLEPTVAVQGAPRDAAKLLFWADMIRCSEKIALGDRGVLVSGDQGLPVGMLPDRMPAPLISLEVPFPSDPSPGEVLSTRRHILCREMSFMESGGLLRPVDNPEAPQGFLVMISNYMDQLRAWVPAPNAAYVRYDQPIGAPEDFDDPAARPGHPTYYFAVIPILEQLRERMIAKVGQREYDRAAASDSASEVQIAIEFCHVMAAGNVKIVRHEPSAADNRRRARLGKELFAPYGTVQIQHL
jgi:hypothetical protein